MSNSTWLITGASSGLGYTLAEHVLKQGDRVVLADVSTQSIIGAAANLMSNPFILLSYFSSSLSNTPLK